MFIRRTKTRTSEDGTQYFSYRLVRNERQGDRVRQRTLLNLGSHFPVEKRHWRLLCARITQLIGRQETLLPLPWPDEVEAEAQRIAARLVSRSPPVAGAGPGSTLETVDVASLEMVRPRSAGVEHVGLWAMEQLGLEELLEHLGFNRRSRAVAMGSIIGRMAVPGSERATWRWLCERSALGELLDVDFETMCWVPEYSDLKRRVCPTFPADSFFSDSGAIRDGFSSPSRVFQVATLSGQEQYQAASFGAARSRPAAFACLPVFPAGGTPQMA